MTDPEPFVFYPGDEKIRIADMPARLNLEAQFFERKSKVTNTAVNPTIIIRADAEVPTGLIQELIRLCRESKFEKFHLKAKAEEL